MNKYMDLAWEQKKHLDDGDTSSGWWTKNGLLCLHKNWTWLNNISTMWLLIVLLTKWLTNYIYMENGRFFVNQTKQ